MDRAKAIDRARKLIARAGSSNEFEAAVAAAAVTTHLAKYRLTRDDIEAETLVEHLVAIEPGWPLALYAVLAGGCGCSLVQLIDRERTGLLVGTRLDAFSAMRLYYRIRQVLRRRVDEAWVEHERMLTDPIYGGDGKHPALREAGAEAQFRESFLAGAIEVVRLTLGGKVYPQVAERAETISDAALVLTTTSREQAYARALAYVKQKFGAALGTPQQTRTLGMGAYRAGKKVQL